MPRTNKLSPEERLRRRRESGMRWYAANKERSLEYNRRWRKANRHLINSRAKASRESNREAFNAYRREYYAANKEKISSKHRGYELKSKYGLSHSDYMAMIAAQEGKCFICRERPKRLCVDHSHRTGKVRKLLCTRCNTAIGSARERTDILHGMVQYLLSHEGG